MLINLESYLTIIKEHGLTQRQLLFMILIYHKENKLLKLYKEAFTENSSELSEEELRKIPMLYESEKKDLIDKEFLKPFDTNAESLPISAYKLTEKFTQYYVDEYVAINELIKLYPPFSVINGKNIPLLSMDKDNLRKTYVYGIGYDLKEHQEVKKDLEFGVENDLINMGIEKFVNSNYWNALREKRIEAEKLETISNKKDTDL